MTYTEFQTDVNKEVAYRQKKLDKFCEEQTKTYDPDHVTHAPIIHGVFSVQFFEYNGGYAAKVYITDDRENIPRWTGFNIYYEQFYGSFTGRYCRTASFSARTIRKVFNKKFFI